MSDGTSPEPPPGPLAGIRVVDMTIWMAGAVSGMLLADLGADVVKVESPRGDPTRSHAAPTAGRATATPVGTSISYSTCNRNKRSIALDLGSAADREVFGQLIAAADVFVTNLSPSTIRKLGIDDASLRARNPSLVCTYGSGLGPSGPRADDLAQDMTGMAYAGMLFTMSAITGEPFAPPGAMNDVITGTYLFGGILAPDPHRRHGPRRTDLHRRAAHPQRYPRAGDGAACRAQPGRRHGHRQSMDAPRRHPPDHGGVSDLPVRCAGNSHRTRTGPRR